jgi:hypothetical protein
MSTSALLSFGFDSTTGLVSVVETLVSVNSFSIDNFSWVNFSFASLSAINSFSIVDNLIERFSFSFFEDSKSDWSFLS